MAKKATDYMRLLEKGLNTTYKRSYAFENYLKRLRKDFAAPADPTREEQDKEDLFDEAYEIISEITYYVDHGLRTLNTFVDLMIDAGYTE